MHFHNMSKAICRNGWVVAFNDFQKAAVFGQ